MTNIIQKQEDSYKLSSTWIINPFASVLGRDGENYAIKSPVIESQQNQRWQVTMDFIHLPVTSPLNFQFTGHDACSMRDYQPLPILPLFGGYMDAAVNFCQRRQHRFELKITFANLKDISETSDEGKYFYSLCVINELYGHYDLHTSPMSSSKIVVEPSEKWLYFEELKLSIKIKCVPAFPAAVSPGHFGISSRLAALREVEPLQDFTILVGGQELKTNRTMLALASPVFWAMFSHDCKENHEQVLRIKDVDVHTVSKFLDYVYTGQNPTFVNVTNAVKLFHMAEKYQVDALKKVCLGHIRASTTDENGLSQLLLSLQPSY